MSQFRKKLEDLFGIDIRALAFLRISFGFLIILDLINQSKFIHAFYSDEGILPRIPALSSIDSSAISLHFLGGSVEFQSFLFLLTGLSAFCMMIGFKTRLSTFLTWFLLCSWHTRHVDLLASGDRYLQHTLFWGIFLPLGACYSIDNLIKPCRYYSRILSMASAGFLLQVSFLYIFAGFLKTGNTWVVDGTAVFICLNLEVFGRPINNELLKYPLLLYVINYLTLWLERWVPLLMFVPFRTSFFRLVAAVSFALFHLGLLITMQLQFFHWFCLAALIPLVPAFIWDKFLGSGVTRPDQQRFRTPLLVNVLLFLVISYVFYWNMSDMRNPLIRMPDQLRKIGHFLNLNQHWGMFAPDPMNTDAWIVTPAVLRNGEVVDVRTGKIPDYTKPAYISEYNKDFKWTLFYLNGLNNDNYRSRLYADYLCRQWNKTNPPDKEVDTLQIVSMRMRIYPSFKQKEAKSVLILSLKCGQEGDVK